VSESSLLLDPENLLYEITMPLPRPEGAPGDYFAGLGVDSALLQRVMNAALGRGGEDCDLYFQHKSSCSVQLSDHKVNQANTQVDLGMGVRVVVGDQVGYAYSEELSPESMIAAARAAAEIATGQGSTSAAVPKSRSIPDYTPVEQPWHSVGMQERVDLVRLWEQEAFARSEEIQRVQAYLADAAQVVMIVRPDGRLFEDWRPSTIAYLQCIAERDGVRESANYNVASRGGLEYYTKERQTRLVDEAVSRTRFLLGAGKPPAGEMPVVLAAGPSAILLHEAIGHGMEADFNRKRTSIYADKMGERIACDDVTIVDDGTITGSRGALNVDDEGNATERTVLVENGVLSSYIHDEISARHYNVRPTGSGRRQSFRHAPIPRMRATMMMGGPRDPEEIIQSVDKGLYCVTFSNGQVNIGGGDFSFYMRQGYLIENGKLTQPVKDVNIIGNGPQALEQIDLVGNDPKLDEGGWTCGKDGQGVPVSQGMPTVRVQSLTVGGVG
jgi:TldD protein